MLIRKRNYIEQASYTDYGYIMYLAGKYGKTVYCHGNTVHVKTEITPTDDDVVLERGKTIISARTKTDLAAQLSAVTATGWNMRKCSGFTATATMKDVPLKIGGEYCWEDNAKGYDSHKVWQLSSSSFTDEKDAMEVARSVLLGRSLQFQSCEAKTEGNCRIRPGNRLTVKYLGKHSDGEYLVYSVEHSLSAQYGYFTTCHLKRNFCGVSNNRSISAIDRERIDRQGTNAQEETAAATSASGNQTESQKDTEESNAEEKSPKISSPRWEDENGRTITKALVGDEVFLCADVTDIADGATAKINIVEKDGDGNDDFVADLSTSVQDVSVIQLLSLMIKVRSRQAVKLPAVQPVVRLMAHCATFVESIKSANRFNIKSLGGFYGSYCFYFMVSTFICCCKWSKQQRKKFWRLFSNFLNFFSINWSFHIINPRR